MAGFWWDRRMFCGRTPELSCESRSCGADHADGMSLVGRNKNSGQPRMLCITQPGIPAVLPAECVLKVLHFLISNSERTEVMFHGAHSFLSHYLERKNIEYQNQLLARQVEEVQNIYLTMRGWRHDYHNHLQSMKAYVEMGQYDKLQEYLGLLENDLDQVNQLCDSGNVNLDAILNSKISLAEKNGIRVDYKAACPANLTVSDIDLCALIGNLIDNAVEACEGLADPYIRLYIGVLKNQLYISVTNATKDTVRKLDSEYITTKRGNHGHGLKRINLVVEKYKGYINRQNEPGVFVTEIMLPL